MGTYLRTLSTLALGLLITTNAFSQAFLTNGLIAHYPFDGNANDVSGRGNNGTVLGATPTLNRFGNPSRAYSFDGNSGGISSAEGIINIGQAEYTISFWFAMRDWDIFLSFADGVAGLITTHPHTGIGIGFDINRVGYLVNNLGPGNAFWTSLYQTGQKHDYSTNRWYHVAFVKNGTTYKMFVDGILDLTLNHSESASFDYLTTLMIGGDNSNFVISGAMDDVRIYSRALATTEVAQLFAIESTEACSPHKATATASLVNGFVVGANISDPGCGYTNPPTVLLQGGGGIGATATATINDGQVTSINIITAGCCYTNSPKVVIGSPPFVPTVSIEMSKVKVTQKVVLGRNYVLESSSNLVDWNATGPQFTADSESIVSEFDVAVTGRFFRIRQVQ